ncbi:hypothetical protein JCM5296_007290, partial [Sporobolomyces johnsonii]
RAHLEDRLSVKWDSEPSFYLGVAIERDKATGTVKLQQARYVDDVLRRFKMEDCATEPTPIAQKCALSPGTPQEIADARDLPLGQLVGCLLYLACWTRPDIAAAVSRMASFVSKPTQAAWTAAKRIVCYLKGTRDVGIVYRPSPSPVQLAAMFSFSKPLLPSSSTSLTAYSDADWAACLDTRRSTTGNVILLAGGPIDWISRRQQTVATSTSQAEYQALAETGGQIVFLRGLLDELGFRQADPTLLRGDNQASHAMAKASSSHRYTRHVDIKYHYIRELVDAGVVSISYITTHDMLADVFTKGLGRDLHLRFVRAMGLDGQSLSRGSVDGTFRDGRRVRGRQGGSERDAIV